MSTLNNDNNHNVDDNDDDYDNDTLMADLAVGMASVSTHPRPRRTELPS